MPQASKPKRNRLPGTLDHPISKMPKTVARHYVPGGSDKQIEDFIEEDVERQRFEKMKSLPDYLSIDQKDGWYPVALKLAIKTFDGLKLEAQASKPVGAPRRWRGAAGIQFTMEVEGIMTSEKCNLSQAIETLCQIDPTRYPPEQKESLRKRYYEIKTRGRY
jgi:hypothetical protein